MPAGGVLPLPLLFPGLEPPVDGGGLPFPGLGEPDPGLGFEEGGGGGGLLAGCV